MDELKKQKPKLEIKKEQPKEAIKKEQPRSNPFAIKQDLMQQVDIQAKKVQGLPKLKEETHVENPLKEIVKPVKQKQIPSVTPAMSTRKLEEKSKVVKDRIQAFDHEEFSRPIGIDRKQNQTPNQELKEVHADPAPPVL